MDRITDGVRFVRTEGPTHIKTAARIECGRIVKSANTPTPIRMPEDLPPQGIDMRPGILYLFLFTQSLCKIPQAGPGPVQMLAVNWVVENGERLPQTVYLFPTFGAYNADRIFFVLVFSNRQRHRFGIHFMAHPFLSHPEQHTLARAHIHTHVRTHARARTITNGLVRVCVCVRHAVYSECMRDFLFFLCCWVCLNFHSMPSTIWVCAGAGAGVCVGARLRVSARTKRHVLRRERCCARVHVCLSACAFFLCS